MKRLEGSFSTALEMRSKNGREGVFTLERIPAGALIITLRGPPIDRPNRYSIQIDDRLHLDERGSVDGEMLHSCVANAFVDSSDLTRPGIRALDLIEAGSEITINYCAFEDEISEPFRCRCGAKDCYGMVRGYSRLSSEQRLTLAGQASPYLLRKYGFTGVPTEGLHTEGVRA